MFNSVLFGLKHLSAALCGLDVEEWICDFTLWKKLLERCSFFLNLFYDYVILYFYSLEYLILQVIAIAS